MFGLDRTRGIWSENFNDQNLGRNLRVWDSARSGRIAVQTGPQIRALLRPRTGPVRKLAVLSRSLATNLVSEASSVRHVDNRTNRMQSVGSLNQNYT